MSLLISVDIKKKKKERKKREKKKKIVWYMYSRPWSLDFSLQKSDWHFLVKLHLFGIPFYPVMAQLKCLMATGEIVVHHSVS